MVLAAAWAPQIQRFPTLWLYLQSILAYVTPPAVVVFFFGVLWGRANSRGALAALGGGVLLGCSGWVCNEILGLMTLHYLYAAGILFVISSALMVGVSWATEPPDRAVVAPLLWRGSRPSEDAGPSQRRFRLLSVALLLLCAVIVVWWW
jgi:SSS family solute:Na+ symporter